MCSSSCLHELLVGKNPSLVGHLLFQPQLIETENRKMPELYHCALRALKSPLIVFVDKTEYLHGHKHYLTTLLGEIQNHSTPLSPSPLGELASIMKIVFSRKLPRRSVGISQLKHWGIIVCNAYVSSRWHRNAIWYLSYQKLPECNYRTLPLI